MAIDVYDLGSVRIDGGEWNLQGARIEGTDLADGSDWTAVHETSGEFYVRAEAAQRLFGALAPVHRGASPHTLARRVTYGGRKGRRAWHRLRAMGYVGILRVNDEKPIALPAVQVWTTRGVSA
jgi:hypothetical protein